MRINSEQSLVSTYARQLVLPFQVWVPEKEEGESSSSAWWETEWTTGEAQVVTVNNWPCLCGSRYETPSRIAPNFEAETHCRRCACIKVVARPSMKCGLLQLTWLFMTTPFVLSLMRHQETQIIWVSFHTSKWRQDLIMLLPNGVFHLRLCKLFKISKQAFGKFDQIKFSSNVFSTLQWKLLFTRPEWLEKWGET